MCLCALFFLIWCNVNKSTGPAPLIAKTVRFSRDTLLWNVLFIDTVHADSLGAAADGKGVTLHLIDSRQGMIVRDSVFSWTPKDTGGVYINATVCGGMGGCDTLRDTLHVRFAAIMSRPFRLSRDTVTRFVGFTDTLRPDSVFKVRFGDAAFALHCPDSVPRLSAHDSVLSLVAPDTGRFRFRIAQCIEDGPCDTLAVTLNVVNGPLPPASFRFSADTVCLNWAFYDTLRASRLATGGLSGFTLTEGALCMSVKDSIFFWIPRDSGLVPVAIVARDSAGKYYAIRDTFFVRSCPTPAQCPSYTHKNDASTGRPQDLPNGFFIYSYEYNPANQIKGLYISDIRNFSPGIIPGTENEAPRSLNISDDGKWILYAQAYDAYLVTIDGSRKYHVPLPGASKVLSVAFYRNGPNGTEICYTTGDTVRNEIYAIGVTLDSVPVFGASRTLADLTGGFRIEPYYPISVSKDRILGAFSLLYQGAYVLRMGFLTIPSGGRGMALPENMFKWKDETGKQFWGCNSTMSFDGTQCLYVPGAGGTAGAYGSCIPPEHRGFVVTPFRLESDPSITMDDHIDVYGLSINWCPSQYNFGLWDEMDFHGWYFGNNNDLVIGAQSGTLAPVKGVWMVNWKRNIWTLLTPADSAIAVSSPAVFFTGADSGNPLDPHYRVVYPNGGESFIIGQACTVSVTSRRDAAAAIRLKIDNGKYSFLLPGTVSAINPRIDSVFIFTMPASFTKQEPNPQTGALEDVQIPSASDSCRICVQDYTAGSGFSDCSDAVFKITAGH